MRDNYQKGAPADGTGGRVHSVRGGQPTQAEDRASPTKSEAAVADERTMRAFLSKIIAVYGDAEGLFEIAWDIGNPGEKGQLARARLFDAAADAAMVSMAMAKNNDGRNVYIGPALRRSGVLTGKRTSDADISLCAVVWADFDGPGDLDDALDKFDQVGARPNWVTLTGEIPHRRGQCFWFLTELAPLAEIEALLSGIIRWYRGDPSVRHIGRVMRLAGSVSWPRDKPGRVPELTRAISERTRADAYCFAELRQLLAPPRVNAAEGGAHDNSKRNGGGRMHFPHPDQDWANAALERACSRVAGAAVGTRNETLNAEAFGLGQIVGRGLLEKNVVECRLRAAARQCGLDDAEIDTMIPRALEDGMKEPRGPAKKNDRDDADANTGPLESLEPLEVATANLPKTASQVIKLLSQSANLFDRDGPATVSRDASSGAYVAYPLTAHGVARETHAMARPFVRVEAKSEEKKPNKNGSGVKRRFVTVPERVCLMALDDRRAWRLRPLDGFASAPLLGGDGSIRTAEGYDPLTRMFCYGAPTVDVPNIPTEAEAKAALTLLRKLLCTFAFADAIKTTDAHEVDVVDLREPPGEDESAALHALLTAVCRPCLWTAPMLLVTAPTLSGAGAGKGKLVRVICAIAFGKHPSAVTPGHDSNELDKRIVGALVRGDQVVFLDNLNGRALRSDTLASAITERPAKLRIMGTSRLVEIAATAFIAVTGNGLSVSEDLARRVMSVAFDAGVENPEARTFTNDVLADAFEHRAAFLCAALTIWRWGRQAQPKKGKSMGSFEQWGQWVRDPLVALGCKDPADRVVTTKLQDPRRAATAELFMKWNEHHADTLVSVAELHPDVRELADPAGRGRQYLASRIRSLAGTRAAGFVLIYSPSAGKWTADKYKLQKSQRGPSSGPTGPMGGDDATAPGPMPPMHPTGLDPCGPNGHASGGSAPATSEGWEGSL